MAASSLLLLIDDIASVLDDVAVMSKLAAKKTAGVLGDDLALNAQQVTGVHADRELPVVWAVAKGSAVNKLILMPAALAISAVLPQAITPLLMLGGAFLCYEGFHKLTHAWQHSQAEDAQHHAELVQALNDDTVDMRAFEREKIKGAIRTDFILSAEIIVISLGSVATAPLATQVLVLAVISVLMTVGVYGFVAGIVKLDDAGLALQARAGRTAQGLGRMILAFAPLLMKGLSVVGTAAMFMVGGGILVHGIGPLHHAVEHLAADLGGDASGWGMRMLGALLPTATGALVGIVAGAAIVAVQAFVKRLARRRSPA
jgi:predicted DNA repair protein MutK